MKMPKLKVSKLALTAMFLLMLNGVFAGALSLNAFAATQPPSIDLGDLMSQTSELKVSKASAFPAGIDPTKNEKATITYAISATATVKIEIVDEAKSVIVILVNDEAKEGNQDYTIDWDGTDSPVGGGTVMPAGNYNYRITATDPNDEVNQDVVEGTIQLLYGGFTGNEDTDIVDDTAGNPGDNSVANLHNAPPSDTSDTGPETLIYLLLPLLGPVVMKFRKG
jgi:hypothetical protein